MGGKSVRTDLKRLSFAVWEEGAAVLARPHPPGAPKSPRMDGVVLLRNHWNGHHQRNSQQTKQRPKAIREHLNGNLFSKNSLSISLAKLGGHRQTLSSCVHWQREVYEVALDIQKTRENRLGSQAGQHFWGQNCRSAALNS